jgi:sugar lactone lactonase YvrE
MLSRNTNQPTLTKNKTTTIMKTKNTLKHSLGGAVCAATLCLMAPGASAQNMFVGNLGTSGSSISEFPTSGPQSTFATGLDNPNSLAFNSAGDMFVANQFGGNILEYAPGSTTPTTFASGLNNPTSVAFDSAGDLFVSTENNNILEYAAGGGAPTTFGTGLSTPIGLAFNSAGDLFVGNLASDTTGAGFITEFTPGHVQSTFASGLTSPYGLAFNGAGDLFVSDPGAGSILEFNGGIQSTFATGLNVPTGLAFDNSGDLFVADSGINDETGDITEFTASNHEVVFSTSVNKPQSIAFQGETLPVPEPSVMGLFGAGIAAILIRRRKA